jgi:crotonobetainyl-CoA:carnitine CoA-transferase CaiB-like acyl-CoA transferase
MPLRGVRVLDLTRILAGPYATMILGDYGADVVKIEEPGKGDDTRGWGPPWVPGAAGASAYFTAVNRNKRSCTLDLKHPDGREALWRMIDRADVVISNFRAGVMARLGFDYPAVRARNPRAVYALINGYGETGPGSEKPSFDVIVQGESGVMDVTGFPDGPPTRVGISLGDETAGLLAVQGILAALLERARIGEGQQVEVALHDGLLSLLTYHGQNWWAGGARPARLGNAHPSIVPYQTFRAADGWINVGVGNDRQWTALWTARRGATTPASARTATGWSTGRSWCPSWRRSSPPAPPTIGSSSSRRPGSPAAGSARFPRRSTRPRRARVIW